MSSLDKKSSIPRPTHDCDRPGKTKPKAPKLVSQKPAQQSKPAPNDGLIPGDPDAIRRSLQNLEADHVRMKQTLENTVKEAEERLEAMRKLMEEREKRTAETLQTQTKQIEQLEQAVDDCEKKLLENNIDPVTSETLEPTEEEAEQIEKQRKVTKADVIKMREKLHEMSQKSDQYLSDVQHIMQELKELEATSSRAGGLPIGDLPPDDLAFVTEEQPQQMEASADSPSPSSSLLPESQQQEGASTDSLVPPASQPCPQSKLEVFLTGT